MTRNRVTVLITDSELERFHAARGRLSLSSWMALAAVKQADSQDVIQTVYKPQQQQEARVKETTDDRPADEQFKSSLIKSAALFSRLKASQSASKPETNEEATEQDFC